MIYYRELTLIPQVEISKYFIWTKIYAQLHLALVEMKDSEEKIPIGISFPEYRYEPENGGHLGNKLRVFAQDEATLERLNLSSWFSRLSDYIHSTGIREVPSNRGIKYAQYSRYHVKGGPEKLARRRAKRHKMSLEEAANYYQGERYLNNLPYIQLKSLTTQQSFRLCIEKRECSELIEEGFGTYGLSSSSTVPEF